MKSPLSNRPDAGSRRAAVALAALGVVFGDIGTSPLYAFRVCLSDQAAGTPATESALGIVSLMVWTLLIVVTLKYAWLILSVDNDGEGGILALSSLVGRALGARVDGGGRHRTILWLGIFGTTLFLADGMITPAISVLSAIEGIEVVAPGTEFLVVPVTLVLLGLLFAVQRRGTAWVGALFGPVIVVWFATIGVLGLRGLCGNPAVLAAINPLHALGFLARHRLESLHILGSVFLVATGAEALYADLGHFGARPIRIAWTGVALPCLLLNYLGQAALVMDRPEVAANPFYHLAPGWFRIPILLLAAAATLIASQAVITGAFSVARQAVMLGLTPRLDVRHTSSAQEGQVYVPVINWLLLAGAVVLVIGFGRSEGIAHAYGLAVALTMLITSFVFVIYLRRVAGWTVWRCWLVAAPLLAIDVAFALANGSKLLSGGWLPLVVAGCGFYAMMTWHRGQGLLRRMAGDIDLSEGELLRSLRLRQPAKVRGAAIFLTRLKSGVPRLAVACAQAHQVAARERGAADRGGGPQAAGGGAGPLRGDPLRAGVPSPDRELRVHGATQRAGTDGRGAEARSAAQASGLHLLPRAADPSAGHPAAVALVLARVVLSSCSATPTRRSATCGFRRRG